ncbi:MAG: hypothetical protein R3Y38_07790, partial [Rikenellaceae bacterium]
GLRTIAGVSGISRNTLKKYLRIYNSLDISFEELLSKSDTDRQVMRIFLLPLQIGSYFEKNQSLS